MTLTPMMQQYMNIKKKYKEHILFFRLGDFYEMFFDDAVKGSKAMEITLTSKSCGLEEKAPMCGVPYHAADTYIAKLIAKGFKVAICEQMEDPAATKGIVRREVVRIITPGTVLSQTMLNESENNYLASLWIDEEGAGLAFCDISTGEIGAIEQPKSRFPERLMDELTRLAPKEILSNCNLNEQKNPFYQHLFPNSYLTVTDKNRFDLLNSKDNIMKQFQVDSLHSLGLSKLERATKALGALLSYLFETQKQQINHLLKLTVSDLSSNMSLDSATMRNLELTETLFEGKIKGSLLGILDKTNTAMGSRKIRQWLKSPLIDLSPIVLRQNAVMILSEDILFRNDIRESLRQIYDLERLTGRISCGAANGRDLIALANSLLILPALKQELLSCKDPKLVSLGEDICDLSSVVTNILSALVEDPPVSVKEGGIIRKGYSAELDDIKSSIFDGQSFIAGLEVKERERTGIKNLKVGFNKVFGYYIEVTKSNYDAVPADYIRKQTLVNSERYITSELKDVETVVLNAEARINQMEYEIFTKIRTDIQKYVGDLQTTASALAELDVITSFAEVSSRLGYVRPEISISDVIMIEKGRHPVLDQMIKDGMFVSNDTYIDRDEQSMLLITGPNMSGKSTYMRQTALIVLMAQCGCFVPAIKAKIGLVDRIYTRIGASDNLVQGKSTFLSEMSELACILNSCTDRSLVILDEIGRGTSTYDGLSIAFAVLEHLCSDSNKVRTLFATHYHELTSIAMRGLKNLNVAVKEENGDIIFLHKIIEGSASKSYGIHVAKLAGIPAEVLESASRKLIELEKNNYEIGLCSQNKMNFTSSKSIIEEPKQLSIFDILEDPIIERLRSLDLMEITPSMAIKLLEELKDAAKQ